MMFEKLAPELREKAKACKTPEDIMALAKEEGYMLSDDELANVSGGGDWSCDNSCDTYDPEPHSR